MAIEQKPLVRAAEEIKEDLKLPRRGFLQKCALVTGVFLAGTLRLDRNLVDASTSVKHYCCYLMKPRANCVLAECKSQFWWICNWGDKKNSEVLIRCVECFDIEISLESDWLIEQGWTEIESHYEHLRCSKAFHPADREFAEFGR